MLLDYFLVSIRILVDLVMGNQLGTDTDLNDDGNSDILDIISLINLINTIMTKYHIGNYHLILLNRLLNNLI